MAEMLIKFARDDKTRERLDWAVFSLGLLSLSTAIGATLLT